jgi:hypothetical protein
MALSGCTFSGLDQFERETCEDDACCADLNVSMPSGDVCSTWQQDAITGYCDLSARDDDGDDHPAAECAVELADCDDTDGARYPGATEICDGIDQSCDGVIDENANGIVAAAPFPLDEDTDHVEAASAGADEVIALALEGRLAERSLHLVRAPAGMDASADELDVEVRVDGAPSAILDLGAIAQAGGGHAVLLRPTGCPRWALAALDGTNITSTAAAFDVGFPRGELECRPDIGPSALAADDDGDVLAAWIVEGNRGCGAGESPLRLAVGRVDGSAATVGIDVYDGGTISEEAAPSILNDGDDTFLVAHARGDLVVIRRVTIDEATLSVETVELVDEQPATAPGDAHLARGEGESFALSWREGCAGETDVVTAFYASATAEPQIVRSGAGVARRFPSATWQPRSREWVVAWRESSLRVGALRYDASLTSIGDPFELVGMGVSDAPFVVARGEGPSFGALTLRFDGARALISAATFGCGP